MIPAVLDDQIIQLTLNYDSYEFNKTKDEFSYLRDCCYYAFGFTFLRSFGFSYEDAKGKFNDASSNDGRYTNNLPLDDNEIITLTNRFISRYKIVGRFQTQTRQENARDLFYWTVYYLRNRSGNKELALQVMENGMMEEANLPLPYPPQFDFPWEPKGKLFYANGKPIIHKGFSAFPLLNRYEQGIDIRPWLDQFNGYNAARVLLYTPEKDWGNQSWGFPTNQVALDFLNYLKDKGILAKFCLITDDDKSKIEQAKGLIGYLREQKPTNLILEAVNEPGIHDKIDPSELKNLLSGSGFPYASGWYIDTKKHYGTYWVDHSPRDNEWFRKGGHNLYEAYVGGGPNDKSEPALRQAAVEDEGPRPDQVGNDILGLYAYAASCVLFGAGATYHCNAGKFCSSLDSNELECKDAFLRGLNAFGGPIDGITYNRIVESGNEQGGPTQFARTFTNGNYAIRIKQATKEFPESGWKALDEYGICWVRG